MKKLSEDVALEALQGLTLLRFFPQNPHALQLLAELVTEWCESKQQCIALVNYAVREWDEWNGSKELRALYLEMFPPAVKVSSRGVDPTAIWRPDWEKETSKK